MAAADHRDLQHVPVRVVQVDGPFALRDGGDTSLLKTLSQLLQVLSAHAEGHMDVGAALGLQGIDAGKPEGQVGAVSDPDLDVADALLPGLRPAGQDGKADDVAVEGLSPLQVLDLKGHLVKAVKGIHTHHPL